MRIRAIKPGFFLDEQLAELKPLARILFIGLWCAADRRGRLEDRPKRLKAEILPYDDCDPDELLSLLVGSGHIRRYEVDGIRVIWVIRFEEHQRITGKEAETESELPEYQQGSERETPGKQPGNNGDDRKGREGKGTEGKDTPPSPSKGAHPSAEPDPAVVELFDYWKATTGHRRATLPTDPKDLTLRRLTEAIKTHGLDKCKAVVRGAKADPWPDRPKHDTCDILFRDSAHVEKFAAMDPQDVDGQDRIATAFETSADRLRRQLEQTGSIFGGNHD